MNEAKTALGKKIIAAKKAKGWTWPQVAEKLGFSPGLDLRSMSGADVHDAGDGGEDRLDVRPYPRRG